PTDELVALKEKPCVAAGLSRMTEQTAPLKVPSARPTVLVLSGPSEVSVVTTVPPVSVLVKVNTPALAGMSVPWNDSLTVTGVGATTVVVLPQAPASAASAASTTPRAI